MKFSSFFGKNMNCDWNQSEILIKDENNTVYHCNKLYDKIDLYNSLNDLFIAQEHIFLIYGKYLSINSND